MLSEGSLETSLIKPTVDPDVSNELKSKVKNSSNLSKNQNEDFFSSQEQTLSGNKAGNDNLGKNKVSK